MRRMQCIRTERLGKNSSVPFLERRFHGYEQPEQQSEPEPEQQPESEQSESEPEQQPEQPEQALNFPMTMPPAVRTPAASFCGGLQIAAGSIAVYSRSS